MSGTLLAAVNAGRLPNGRIFTIGIAVPTLSAMRKMAAMFRGLAEGSRIYDSSDVWPMVAACLQVGSAVDDLKASPGLNAGGTQELSAPPTRPNGRRGKSTTKIDLAAIRAREANQDTIRKAAERARHAAAQVLPGEERILAVRDSAFETLERRGELTLLQDVCRVTGMGLLRVYRDGVCKWSVVPV